MTELAQVRTAIVAAMGELSLVAEAWEAAHAQDLKAVLWHTRRFPSAAVAALSIPAVRMEGGAVVVRVAWAVFLGTKDAPAKAGDPPEAAVRRDALGLLLTRQVVKAVALASDWGTEKASKPEDIKARNLTNLGVDKSNVALWVVTWEQDITLGDDEELDALGPFLLAHVDYDAYVGEPDTDDGVPEAQDDIELPQ